MPSCYYVFRRVSRNWAVDIITSPVAIILLTEVYDSAALFALSIYIAGKQWPEKQTELDGQGKARREAARRRNSECKINLSCRNSSRGNGCGPTAQW